MESQSQSEHTEDGVLSPTTQNDMESMKSDIQMIKDALTELRLELTTKASTQRLCEASAQRVSGASTQRLCEASTQRVSGAGNTHITPDNKTECSVHLPPDLLPTRNGRFITEKKLTSSKKNLEKARKKTSEMKLKARMYDQLLAETSEQTKTSTSKKNIHEEHTPRGFAEHSPRKLSRERILNRS